MNVIISSPNFINNFTNILSDINFKYKFLLLNDLLKKINKKYLNESKILYLYYDEPPKNLINVIQKYEKQIQIFFINIDNFTINNSSLFFLNEFFNSKLTISNLESFFNKDDKFILPQIIINKKIKKNIIITGVCRNISKYIFNSIHKFIYLNYYFQDFKIIIYENDSNDNTLKELYDFKTLFNNINIIVITEKNIKGTLTQRISYARNKILNYIHDNELNPDYVINIDMDDILLEFKTDTILYPFYETIEWSMFGANSLIYYDMWALRTIKYPDKDFWEDKKLPLKERLTYYFKIHKESCPIPVISCFNGIGIYKYKHIIDCFYDGNNTCEHITFHKDMINNHNAKLFIHPKLIVGPHKILSKPMGFYKIDKYVKNNI